LPFSNHFAELDKRFRARRWRFVKCTHNGRSDDFLIRAKSRRGGLLASRCIGGTLVHDRRSDVRNRRWGLRGQDQANAFFLIRNFELGELVILHQLDQLFDLSNIHHSLTFSMYSDVRVSTLSRSPSLMWKGTVITRPVSRVAGLPPPLDVSPRMLG